MNLGEFGKRQLEGGWEDSLENLLGLTAMAGCGKEMEGWGECFAPAMAQMSN
jgi:hypothetical protein